MKIKDIVIWGLLWGAIYFVTNNLSLFAPHKLPLLPFEKNISMNEWWMLAYVSWVLYISLFCLLIKKELSYFTQLMTGLALIHGLLFIIYPVEYPRNYDLNSLCALNRFLISCDNPRNCFPSLHVSFIFLTLLAAKRLGISLKIRYLFIIWGAVIIVSVIFVKQHYVIDVLAGVLITSIYFCLFNILKNKREEGFSN